MKVRIFCYPFFVKFFGFLYKKYVFEVFSLKLLLFIIEFFPFCEENSKKMKNKIVIPLKNQSKSKENFVN